MGGDGALARVGRRDGRDNRHAAKEALHLHLNAAMTALNFIKLEDSQQAPDSEHRMISIASWKIRKTKAHLLERFSSILDA